MTTYNTMTVEVDSGEFLAEVEVVISAGSKGDYWTPGESALIEINSGYYFKYDEESGELITDTRYDISTLSPSDMKYLEAEVDKQLSNVEADDDYDFPDLDDRYERRPCC